MTAINIWPFRKGGKKLNRSTWGNGIAFFMLALLGTFMLFPLIYALVQSVKPIDEIFLFSPRLFAQNPTINNFVLLGQLTSNLQVPFSRYLFNSVFVTIVSTLGHVLIASMAAYPLAKHKFPGQKFINEVIVLALLFTPAVTYIPQYVVIAKLGLINTYGAVIFPVLQMSMGIFLMRQFMTQIPDAMIEAARIDGSPEIVTWFSVVMPSVKPAWMTLGLFAFQSIWGNGGGAFIYNESMKLLPTVLSQIQAGGLARAGVGSAVGVVMMIPPLLIFVLTQSQVIETMTTSGIK